MLWQNSGDKIRYGRYKLEPLERTYIETQTNLRKIKKLTTNPAEVAHFDREVKTLIKLFEDVKTP